MPRKQTRLCHLKAMVQIPMIRSTLNSTHCWTNIYMYRLKQRYNMCPPLADLDALYCLLWHIKPVDNRCLQVSLCCVVER